MIKNGAASARPTIFLRDVNDLTRLSGSREAVRFLSSNVLVYQQLREQQLEVSGTWQYIDDKTRREIISEAVHLKDVWYQPLRDSFIYRDINLGDAIKFPFYHFLWEALTSATIAEQLVDREGPGSIELHPFAGIPARYSLAQRSDVPEAIIAYYADRAGLSVEWPRRGAKNNLRTLVRRSLPGPIRRIGSNVRTLLSKTQPASDAHKYHSVVEAASVLNEKSGTYRTVCASAYQSLLMFIPLAAFLERTGDWSTLLVHTGHDLEYASMLTDPRVSDFIDGRESQSFKYLEIFAAVPLQARRHKKFLKHLWHSFISWQKTYDGPHTSVFSNPYLEFQFRYLLTDLMEELCRVVDAAYEIFGRTKPNVLLVGNVSEKDLTVASVAKALKIPSVMVPHNLGWASPEDYEYQVDYIAVQNQGTARFLENLVGEKKLLVAGDLKRKKYANVALGTANARQSDKESRTRVLVLTGGFMPGVFQNCNPGAFYDSLKSLVDHADRQPDWELILRAHPRLEYSEWIRYIVDQSEGFATGRITVETRAVAEEIIPKVDFVLMLDYLSGPAITAWKQGVPIIYWPSSKLIYSLNDMIRADWFPQVTNCLELDQIIQRFFNDKAWHDHWIRTGRELANEYFSAPELPETIFAEMLTEICKNETFS